MRKNALSVWPFVDHKVAGADAVFVESVLGDANPLFCRAFQCSVECFLRRYLIPEIGDQIPAQKIGQGQYGMVVKDRLNRRHGVQVHLGTLRMRFEFAEKRVESLHVHVTNHAVASLRRALCSGHRVADQFLAVYLPTAT